MYIWKKTQRDLQGKENIEHGRGKCVKMEAMKMGFFVLIQHETLWRNPKASTIMKEDDKL